MLCPCGSSVMYHECCEPLHQRSQYAATAEALMRSRYAAFVLQDIDYIVATTAPFQQDKLDKQAILAWSQQTDWVGLEVLNHTPKIGKRHAQVEFNAYFNVTDASAMRVRDDHHELSSFVKIGIDKAPKWYFLDPTVIMAVSQKQPCPCGSGEKYKRCCGVFLN